MLSRPSSPSPPTPLPPGERGEVAGWGFVWAVQNANSFRTKLALFLFQAHAWKRAPNGARFDSPGRSAAESWVDSPPIRKSPNGARFHFASCANAPQESRPVGPCAPSIPHTQGCAGTDGSANWAIESRPRWGFRAQSRNKNTQCRQEQNTSIIPDAAQPRH